MNQNLSGNTSDVVARLKRLTDVIFAVSIVIFIVTGMFSIKDASFWSGYADDPAGFVSARAYELVTSFLVFLFMALYWYTNVRLSAYIMKADATYTWINIIYLFFIAVAPLPNALSIQASRDFSVQIFFGIVMFFIGFLSFVSWFYASKNYRLIGHDISPGAIKATDRELLVEPVVALLSIITSLIDTSLWEPTLLLLPVGMIVVGILNRRANRKGS